jgi:hypothetical protein
VLGSLVRWVVEQEFIGVGIVDRVNVFVGYVEAASIR